MSHNAFVGHELRNLATTEDDDDLVDTSRVAPSLQKPEEGESTSLSGIYFGILNIYTTSAQFLASMMCFVLMRLLEIHKPETVAVVVETIGDKQTRDVSRTDGSFSAISICFFVGAMSTLAAANATRRLM